MVLREHNAENAKRVLDVHYGGTLQMCQAFTPLLSKERKKERKKVHVSPEASTLRLYNPEIQAWFRELKLSLSSHEELAVKYRCIIAVTSDTEQTEGFVDRKKANYFNKACVNVLTAVLAQENEGLVVNACCPGWVDTDMGTMVGKPPKTSQDEAKISVKLAFGDIGGGMGKCWANDKNSETGGGKVQD